MNYYSIFEVEYKFINLSVIWYCNSFYVPIKPIIKHIGLNWKPQLKKLSNVSYGMAYNSHCAYVADERTDGSVNYMHCIPLSSLDNFLKTIDLRSVPERIKKRLEDYQNTCARTLMNSLNSRNLDGVVSIITPVDSYFRELVVKQRWNVEALKELGVYVDPTELVHQVRKKP